MKREELARFGMIALLIILVGVFVFPTPYYYFTSESSGVKIPTRVNRITGKTEMSGKDGHWVMVDISKMFSK
jgi:PDZ domain-containing secreted protein